MPKAVAPMRMCGDNALLTPNGAISQRLATTGTTGTNITIGASAMNTASAGITDAVAIGRSAMQTGTSSATNCVAIGLEALAVANSAGAVAVGSQAGKAMTSGSFNTMMGFQAGLAVTTASYNTLLGYAAGQSLTVNSHSTMVGAQAGRLATGVANTFVGANAGNATTAGGSNTVVGANSGTSITSGSLNTMIGDSVTGPSVGTGNTLVGTSAATLAGNSYSTAMGYQAASNASNAMALGRKTTANQDGAVAIGTDNLGNGATSAVTNQIQLGTLNHFVNIPGTLTVGTGPSQLKEVVLTTITTSTTAGSVGNNVPLRLRNTTTAANTWAEIQFESSNVVDTALIGAKIIDHTTGRGELWFHSRSAAALHPRFRLPETGGAVFYGDAGTAVATMSNLGALSAQTFSPTGLTGATQASRYVGATASGSPASGTFAVGDWVVDRAGAIRVCTVAGTPGTWVSTGGGGGAPNAGWAVTAGYAADKAFSPESTTLTECARVLGTLIDALKTYGILAA
jgi:Head domain of trimeric autotransporter adhesin